MIRSTTLRAIALAALATGVTATAAVADIGPTPVAAAKARTIRYAEREAKSYGGTVTYTMGSCSLLHRRPWVAYLCHFTMYGRGLQCHVTLTLGVRKLAAGEYDARQITSHADGPLDAPC
jgi:hypothetical protein